MELSTRIVAAALMGICSSPLWHGLRPSSSLDGIARLTPARLGEIAAGEGACRLVPGQVRTDVCADLGVFECDGWMPPCEWPTTMGCSVGCTPITRWTAVGDPAEYGSVVGTACDDGTGNYSTLRFRACTWSGTCNCDGPFMTGTHSCSIFSFTEMIPCDTPD
ncbi:MAG: hypothetical protein D8M59_15705 [Planctomycetes bacterium]|nr:hypothetical protein [Planctomycetota bacterium]